MEFFKEDYIPIIKQGDMKIDSIDLNNLFSIIDFYQHIIFNNLDIIDEDEKERAGEQFSLCELLRLKYIINADLRRQEHLWFEVLKLLDDGKYTRYPDDNYEDIKSMKLESCMEIVENIIRKSIELPENMKNTIGMLVCVFEYDNVRRNIWGHYMGVKGKREENLRVIKQEEKRLAEN